MRRSIKGIVLGSLLFLTACAGGRVVLHPIDQIDIIPVDIGQPIGATIAQKQGWYISDYYLKDIMDARIDTTR